MPAPFLPPQNAAGLNAAGLNAVTEPGEYSQHMTSNATTALNYPETVAGALKVTGLA